MDLTKIMGKLGSFPERSIAFYDGGGEAVRKTYPAVRADIERAVEHLRKLGVEAGMRVGLLAMNSYEFVLYDVALIELKCTSLVFPEEFGGRTGRELIRDYGLNLLLISSRDVWPRLSTGEWTAYIDGENPPGTRAREAAAGHPETEYTPAIIFSSGSSGKIKGMLVNPRGVEDTIAKSHRLFNIDGNDSLLVFLPLSGYQQRVLVYSAFFYGLDLYLVKPAQLFTALRDFKPTLCLAPPLLYEGIHNQFVKTVRGMGAARRAALRSLRALARVAPTEALRRRLRQVCYGRIYESLGGRIRVMWTGMAPIKRSTLEFFSDIKLPLFEAYGLTESGAIATNTPAHNRIGSVGKLVDEGSVRLAEGGEIMVSREHFVTRGYVYYDEGDENRTYLDAHTIATGDIGRFDEDGYLYLLGRKKEIIITSQGYKTHPETLEAQINVCPGVERSVIFGNGLPYLAALVSVQQSGDPEVGGRVERHIAQLNRKLPLAGRVNKIHLTTEQFTVDNGLLTRNLKLNRRGLFQRFERELLGEGRAAAPGAGGRGFEEPQTETERALARIWQDVLKVERVGRADDFLDLGGDSLLATQVVSRVRDAFRVDLPLSTLLETRGLAELAKKIEGDGEGAAPAWTAPPIARAPREGDLPLSYAQQRLWFLQQFEPRNYSYNEIAAINISGGLEVEALRRCFDEIIRRHEVLRTTFAATDGRPSQVINPPQPFAVRVVEMQGAGEANRDAEVQRLARELAREPFDLSRGPLLRVSLLRFGPSDHVLLLLMHHIITDGWSTGVLMREAAALYEAYVGGRESPLPELEIQYVDYAVWQRDWLRGEVLARQLEYWKRQLAGAPPVLDLPLARPRPPVQTANGAHVRIAFPRGLSDELEALGQREGASLFMTLLAAFFALLQRYTGHADICIGTPVANRARPELETLIGFFVNTLVLRADLSGDPSFSELLRRVRAAALGAFDNQDVPFEKLVEELSPERRPSHSPLFQVMFVFQNAPGGELTLPGLKLQLAEVESGVAKFDLLLSLTRTADGLAGSIEYNSDLFDADAIARMGEHLRLLLGSATADPARRLSQLTLLTDEERRQLLVGWNDTATEAIPDVCVHEWFAEQAARTPERVAVVQGGERLTYGELNRRANQLAHHLRRRGVGPESRVALCVGRSPRMLVGLLGILKAGGACLSLDPAYPPERLSFMLEDGRVALLLMEERLAGSVPAAPSGVLLLDADWEEVAREGEDDPGAVGLSPENLIYVLYTSGSTGRPKGVAMSHRAITNLIAWQLRQTVVGAGGRTLQFASLNFDAFFQEVFATLCAGGTLVLTDEQLRRDPAALLQYLSDEKVERIFLPFIALQHLAESARSRPHLPISLREVITAGEQLHITPAVTELFTRLDGCSLHNHYGPTECHVVTAYVLDDEVSGWAALPPIGRPIENTQVYVLDAHLRPVPAGVAGEVYLGGVQVARGYLGRPALTAERFIPDPFSAEPGGRLYRTGDVGRWLADGVLEYLGRADDQVKVRGFRIELEEVEAVLSQHPGVLAGAVAARDDGAHGKRLVAYAVTGQTPAPSAGELREYLRRTLPDYMIPSAFVFLDALPLTPSGKVNRRALPEPELARPDLAESYVAPRTPVEEKLAEIWAALLQVERVGVDDNFFDLGGHSLLATQVMSRVNTAFKTDIPLSRLFEATTVARLAEVVESQKRSESLEAEKMARLLERVRQLSPEEAKGMLEKISYTSKESK